PVDLPAPDIDGINFCGAALQKAIGEAAGRGSHIQAALASHRHLEVLKGGPQLETAPSDVLFRTLDFDGSLGKNQETRLVCPLAGDGDPTRHDGSLRPLAGFSKTFSH